MRTLLSLLPVAIAVACSGDATATHAGVDAGIAGKAPQILAKAEEGSVDLSFAVESRKQGPGAGERLVAMGQDGREAVAFAISIEPGWKDVELERTGIPTHQGRRIVIESVGQRSDRLVQALDRLYATNVGAKAMQRATRFTGISLAGDPSALDAGPARIKLFFESEAEDRYAEVYLNIDVRAGSIECNEKDSDYRKAVVLALSGM
ncbi:MAG TPA: hypothetical protein VFZ65_19335 [Planctomycetota bacterium]|nr:hypothetical protein [Planctomycetota bacterium]